MASVIGICGGLVVPKSESVETALVKKSIFEGGKRAKRSSVHVSKAANSRAVGPKIIIEMGFMWAVSGSKRSVWGPLLGSFLNQRLSSHSWFILNPGCNTICLIRSEIKQSDLKSSNWTT